MVMFEEISIPVPWGHIAGKWWGPRDIQPVVALHGWQDNAGTFDTLAPLLKGQGLSVLALDLPGHGLSSHFPTGNYYYIFWDGVHIIRRIVKYFKWRKITLMGHSLGGAISFLYAAVFPDEVDKYISIDIASPAVRDPAKMLDTIGDNLDKFLKYETLTIDQMPCYNFEEMINIVVDAYKGSVNREGCEILMKRGMKALDNDTFCFSRDARLKVSSLGYITIDLALQFASCIKCEVLNIRADPGMVFPVPEYYDMVLDKIAQNAKRIERHLISGTHHLHLNDPNSVAGIIVDFLMT